MALANVDIGGVTTTYEVEVEGKLRVFKSEAEHRLAENGLALPKVHPDLRKLGLAILRARAKAWKRVKARFEGEPIETPLPPDLLSFAATDEGLLLSRGL